MNWFSTFLKRVPPFKAALGLVLLFGTASFSLGAASVNLVGIPARTTDLEKAWLRSEERDQSQDEALSEALEKLERIYCVVRLLADNEGPINPLACEPGGAQ
jgi:hypothetical protein